jgi:hypothetical protein
MAAGQLRLFPPIPPHPGLHCGGYVDLLVPDRSARTGLYHGQIPFVASQATHVPLSAIAEREKAGFQSPIVETPDSSSRLTSELENLSCQMAICDMGSLHSL